MLLGCRNPSLPLISDPMQSKERFGFGQNWQAYLKQISLKESLEEATKHSRKFLGLESLEGMRFLDLGCGSGLFSLMAYRMGASEVVSVDLDPQSVACAKWLREEEGSPSNWKVLQGSALDEKFLKDLGEFSVVYSWGVLHHTGNMKKALDLSAQMVSPGGFYYIAIYNRANPPLPNIFGRAAVWVPLKKAYNRGGNIVKKLLIYLEIIRQFLVFTTRGKNFFTHIKTYQTNRGMSWYRDVVDWVGGHPYEAATPGELFDLLKPHQMILTNLISTESLACNEFLYRRPIQNPFPEEKKPQ